MINFLIGRLSRFPQQRRPSRREKVLADCPTKCVPACQILSALPNSPSLVSSLWEPHALAGRNYRKAVQFVSIKYSPLEHSYHIVMAWGATFTSAPAHLSSLQILCGCWHSKGLNGDWSETSLARNVVALQARPLRGGCFHEASRPGCIRRKWSVVAINLRLGLSLRLLRGPLPPPPQPLLLL